MKVRDIILREIFDSKGETTFEIGLINGEARVFLAQIPTGTSRGRGEAKVLGPEEARRAVKKIKEFLAGKSLASIKEFDEGLLELDRSKNKAELGGNVLLGASIAFTRSLAWERKKEVWQVLREEFFGPIEEKSPLIFSNFIEGGRHAQNNLALQEYLVIAAVKGSVFGTTRRLVTCYRALARVLKEKFGAGEVPLGEEEGYSPNFKDNFEPLSVLEQLIGKLGPGFRLGIDAAATNFWQEDGYLFEGKKLSTPELSLVYQDYFKRAKLLFFLEDPFSEREMEAFSRLNSRCRKKLIVGDDLTVTNPRLIEGAATRGAIGGVVIKPNQIGTVTEACQAILRAKTHSLKIIVSHRSAETEDNFIIHLAKAAAADGVKIGAPLNERIFKFNELIRLYDQ